MGGSRGARSIGCLSTDHGPAHPETVPRLRSAPLNRGTPLERLRWRWRRWPPPGAGEGNSRCALLPGGLRRLSLGVPDFCAAFHGDIAFDPLGRSCLSGTRLPGLRPCPSAAPCVRPAPGCTGGTAGPPRGSGTWDRPTHGFRCWAGRGEAGVVRSAVCRQEVQPQAGVPRYKKTRGGSRGSSVRKPPIKRGHCGVFQHDLGRDPASCNWAATRSVSLPCVVHSRAAACHFYPG